MYFDHLGIISEHHMADNKRQRKILRTKLYRNLANRTKDITYLLANSENTVLTENNNFGHPQLNFNKTFNPTEPTTNKAVNYSNIDFEFCSLNSNNSYIVKNGVKNDLVENFDSLDKSLSPVDELRGWVFKYKISHVAVNKLLTIINKRNCNSCFPNLPSNSRTFLHTPREVDIRNMDPGLYCHLGIRVQIEKWFLINNVNLHTDIIEISVNIDGLPISKSSSSQVYPILCILENMKNFKNPIILVGIYQGNEKPKDFNMFLRQFVDEAIDLTNNGIKIINKTYKFKIKMILMDAVAKSSVLNVKGHSGYSSCTKCTQVGR